jgi:tetratricopeptide (TPR) repeat protein
MPELQIPLPPPPPDWEEERDRLLRAVGDYLQALAGARPLAILLDDLQWADESSLRLLQHLARHRGKASILLLGTYREIEVDLAHPLARAVVDLQREGLVERITLPCLDAAGTMELLRSTVGPVSRGVAGWIYARTDGNPFFNLQLVQALLEQGHLVRRGGRLAGRHLEQAEVPESVREVIGGRVVRLSTEAQRTIRQASVLGQEFEFDQLVAMGDALGERVEEALEEATGAGLMRSAGKERYGFDHTLTQQALYAALPERRRRRYHLAAGQALEGLRDGFRKPRAAELARHFLEGEDPERALHYSLLAGDEAEAVFAHVEAGEHYHTAFDLARRLGDEVQEAAVAERLGGALLLEGRYDEARDALEQAAQIYRARRDLERLGHVTAQIGMVCVTAGWKPAETIDRLRSMLEPLEAGEPTPALIEIYNQLATLLFVSGQYPEQLAAAEHAVRLASLHAYPPSPQAEFYRALALFLLGRLDVGMRGFSAAISIAEAGGDLHNLCELLGGLGVMHILWGTPHEGRSSLERAAELAEQLGNPWQICLWEGCVGLWAFIVGDWAGARQRFERALASGEHSRLPYPLWQRGWMELATGAWDQATQLLERCIAMTGGTGDLQALRWASGLMAELDLMQERPQAAIERLTPLLDRPNVQELDVTFLLPRLAWAQLGRGEIAQALSLATEAVQRARTQHYHLALADALRVQGVVMAVDRRWVEADALFEEAVSLARSMPYPYAEARALFEWGRALDAKGEPEKARERLQDALAIFHRLGAKPYIELTEQALNDLTPVR